jgi:hypothetical protein
MGPLESQPGKSVINRFVDPWIGSPQVEPPDPDVFGQRFGGNGSSVSCHKPTLQEIHPLHDMIDVFGHRTNGIQMLWLNRQNAFQGNEPKGRLQTMPQQAAGTRTEPAVSVPKATSTGPSAAATADPLDDPPGINLHHLLKGFFGVP